MTLVTLERAHGAAPLDIEGLSDAVEALLGEPPLSIRLERTHFPGSRPVQGVLAVELPQGRCRTLIVEQGLADPLGHADRVRASLAKTRNGQKAGFDPATIQPVAGRGLVLRLPGRDERLPGLRLLHEPEFAAKAMQMLTGHHCGPLLTELVAHRLGKRAVLRIRGAGCEVYVRLHTVKSGEGDARFHRHRALWRSLAGTQGLRIPEPLGSLPDIGAGFFAVLPGDPADLEGADVAPVVQAMAALQRLEPAGLTVHSGADEARLLRQWFERCKAGRPDLAGRIAPGLARRLAALEALPGLYRPCHRDLHEKQILVSGGVVGLLDFDTLCLAHPALDAGNLLAHLCLAGLDEAPLRHRLGARDLDLGAGLGLWRSAALYRLAMLHAFTSAQDAVLERLINEAEAHADD